MYYFVCTRCEAKMFALGQTHTCPRCGKRLHSRDKQTPPWWRYGAKQRRQDTVSARGDQRPAREQDDDETLGQTPAKGEQ